MSNQGKCPYILEPVFDTGDLCIVAVNAAEYAPDATGAEDAAPAIQEALDHCHEIGGGTVYLPEGRYALHSNLTIPPAVTLRGEWVPNAAPNQGRGTILCAYHGKNDPNGEEQITMLVGSGLKNLYVFYPEQNLTARIPYSPTFRQRNPRGTDNITVENVTLVNPWRGGQCGPEGNELHTLKNVYITPLNVGFFMDRTTDIGRLIDVHIGPKYWAEFTLTPESRPMNDRAQRGLRGHMLNHVTGVLMARSDWEYVYNVFIEYCHNGFAVVDSPSGAANAQFSSLYLHNCFIGLRLHKMNGVGLAMSDCKITADIKGLYAAIHAETRFDTVAMFNGVDIEGPYPFDVVLDGPGWLSFTNCTFDGWTDTAVFQRNGGITLMQCALGEGDHITMTDEILSAQILGNTFKGGAKIATPDAVAHQVQFADEPLNLPVAPRGGHRTKPTPCRPTTEKLYLAAEYGVTTNPDADNTAALQAALDAAGQTGGVVYLAGGWYRVDGTLHIPDGVELRGVFEVPAHTQAGGAVLRTTHGHGNEDAAPFITMGEGAGIRGLVIQHPNQNFNEPVPYPWAVQSRGKHVYAIDVVFVNSWLGLDFGTYPSDGHYISYLGGAPIRCGVFVGNCATEGWVENIQYNTHYWPRSNFEGRPKGDEWRIHWHNQIDLLDALVFGYCADEHVLGTFVFGSKVGIKFTLQDGRGTRGKIIGHGTDGAEISLHYIGCDDVDLVNTELVAMESPKDRMYILSEPNAAGKMRIYNSLMWGPTDYGYILKGGDLHVQQTNLVRGNKRFFTVEGGNNELVGNFFFERVPHVTMRGGKLDLIGNFQRYDTNAVGIDRTPDLIEDVTGGDYTAKYNWNLF